MPADTGITRLSIVAVPVADQDRSIAFYESLGFEKRVDEPFMGGAMRWVEVYAPEGDTGVALVPPPGGGPVTGRDTGIILQTDSIEATHAAFREAGVDVDAEVMQSPEPGVPHMFWFRDPDGYSLMVVQLTDR